MQHGVSVHAGHTPTQSQAALTHNLKAALGVGVMKCVMANPPVFAVLHRILIEDVVNELV